MSQIIAQPSQDLATRQSLFHAAATIVADSLSVTSRRVYDCTYRNWGKFADENDLSIDDVSYINVRTFINEAALAKTTRQNRLSHMRKILEALTIADRDRYEDDYQAVKSFLKVKTTDDDRLRPGRAKRALKAHEVTRLLDVWRHDESIKGVRNNAMIRLLVYTGLRRAELVMLRWTDIDAEAGLVTVRHGKGGKERVAAILDSTDGTEVALHRLRQSQPDGYEFLFAATNPGPKTRWYFDSPTSDEVVAVVVAKTAKAAGLGKLAPHDLRRTLITIGLEFGGHVKDLQDQAGHVSAATTLRYAQASDARKRREKIKLPFA